MRKNIQAYNAVHDIPEGLDVGYHETLTQAWMRIIDAMIQSQGPEPTADEFCDKQGYLMHKLLLRLYYTRPRIMSLDAKHGWVEPGDLDAQLAVAADLLSAGEVSEPIEARGGLHLLQVVGVEESMIQDFQDVRDEIEAKERNRLFNTELQSYMEELVATSYIISNPPPDAATFEPFVSATEELDEAEPENLGISSEDQPVAGTE